MSKARSFQRFNNNILHFFGTEFDLFIRKQLARFSQSQDKMLG